VGVMGSEDDLAYDVAPVVLMRTAALPYDDVRMRALSLEELVADADLRAIVAVASPSLDTRLREGPQMAQRAREQVRKALAAYMWRSASRATPLGLCAGITAVRIADSTTLRVPVFGQSVVRVRPSVQACRALEGHIQQDLSLLRRSFVRRGDAVRICDDRLVTIVQEADGPIQVEVGRTDEVDRVLGAVRATPRVSVGDLTALFAAGNDGVSEASSLQFCLELVHAGVLCLDSSLPLTIDALEFVETHVCRVAGSDHPIVKLCRQLRDVLVRVDNLRVEVALHNYNGVTATVGTLLQLPTGAAPLHVDLVRAGPCTLDTHVVSELFEAVRALTAIVSDVEPPRLRLFRERFVRRFGERAVPLVDALDDAIGVGYEAAETPDGPVPALLDGLYAAPPAEQSLSNCSERERWLTHLFQRATASGSRQLDLREVGIAAPAVARRPLPNAFAVNASLLNAGSATSVRAIINWVGGPSGANTIARFIYADDSLSEAVREHVAREEALQPGVLFAEVVDAPDAHLANVVRRPALRGFEIPCGVASALPVGRQIALDDLLVQVTVQGVEVWSRSHGMRIAPRATTAYISSARRHPVARFLTDISTVGVAYDLRWTWGSLERSPWLPRIVHGSVVLSPMRFRLPRTDWLALLQGDILRVREQHALPRFVITETPTAPLVLDLDQPHTVRDAATKLEPSSERVLSEWLVGELDSPVTDSAGQRYAHELVLPFVRRPRLGKSGTPSNRVDRTPTVARARSPGGEWLYCRLYAGREQMMRLLRGPVKDVLQGTSHDRWFFVLYRDPDPHIRLRIRGNARELWGGALPALSARLASLFPSHVGARLVVDTYEPEYQRYGGIAGVDLAELLAHADSDTVMAVVCGLDDAILAESRWRCAALGVHTLLQDARLSLLDCLALTRRLADGFGSESGHDDPGVAARVGTRFRSLRREFEQLLSNARTGRLEIAVRSFAERSGRHQELFRKHGVPPAGVLEDLVHLNASRWFGSYNRRQEAVVYDFLQRYYISVSKRGV
jgi:thiopeptide-type bacteriocin biosynthesis protein